MPQTSVKFGGVYFEGNKNIKSKSTVKQNGETYYVVKFNSGAEIKYPQQKNMRSPEAGGPTIGIYRDCDYGNPSYSISNVDGATFKGGADNDNISLFKCTNTVVNVRDGGNDFVYNQYCSKTRIIADKNDVVYKPDKSGTAYAHKKNLDVTF